MLVNRRILPSLLLAFAFVLPLSAQMRASWDDHPANIYQAGGAALSLPSTASPAAAVAQFLAGRGRDAATVRSLVAVSQWRADNGFEHARFEQRVGSRSVYGSYAKAAFNARGQLVHLIENLADARGMSAAAPSVDERQALRVALARLHPGVATPSLVQRERGIASFARGAFFHVGPTVESVLIPMTDGSLRNGYVVTTWTEARNLLHETLVSGDGAILNVESRTNTDSYNVFPIDPYKSAQEVRSGPAPTTASPAGWLGTGSQSTISIAGNNAHAYLDTDNDGAPDAGGTIVTTGDFLTAADLTMSPSVASNQAVAAQNLFYLNNRVHDVLYEAGFVEAEGNFQEDNFGRGGRGSDSVNAEAQDGGGTDNANFATPREGQNPRMQMYLWTGRGSHAVDAGGSTYVAEGAAFGPALDATGLTATLVVAVPSDGCTTISSLTGIAVIDRGTCSFVTKVKNAQDAGASGVIVVNNAGDDTLTMGGTDATITIPSVFVGSSAGLSIKAAAGQNGTIRLADPPPLQHDGDLDSDIVYHEYGHGLTWRMIGRMSGPLAGAIGEGMSDVLAIVLNDDDAVGEYAFDRTNGIRRSRYSVYPLTYASVTGAEVHDDGEIYGAIGWRLHELYSGNGLTTADLLRDLVQGMTFTPARPSFEQMRDGILAAAPGHACLIWTAFAQYGVGEGAKGAVRGSNVVITESFAVPAGVCP